eukprot:scaffold282354_cov17-Prasinocladus_malaysianus.AAC.1
MEPIHRLHIHAVHRVEYHTDKLFREAPTKEAAPTQQHEAPTLNPRTECSARGLLKSADKSFEDNRPTGL